MMKNRKIFLRILLTLFLTNAGMNLYLPSTSEKKEGNANIAAEEPMQAISKPLPTRLLLSSVEPFSIFFFDDHFSHFGFFQQYVKSQHLKTDSPIKAYKFALGQYTSDY